jgi:hypothetical protein
MPGWMIFGFYTMQLMTLAIVIGISLKLNSWEDPRV